MESEGDTHNIYMSTQTLGHHLYEGMYGRPAAVVGQFIHGPTGPHSSKRMSSVCLLQQILVWVSRAIFQLCCKCREVFCHLALMGCEQPDCLGKVRKISGVQCSVMCALGKERQHYC